MTPAACPRRGVYLLTPDESDTSRLLARVECALSAGIALLQYRNKLADARRQREQATALLPLCRAYHVPLLINDSWQLACDVGADGAHLGQHDGELTLARAALGPNAILGASCYNRLALAEQAVSNTANYVAFGAFFSSTSKPLATRADLTLLDQAANLPIPKVAIGGIRPDNARTVIAAGADLIAVIGGVFDAPDPAAAVRAYLSCFPESETT